MLAKTTLDRQSHQVNTIIQYVYNVMVRFVCKCFSYYNMQMSSTDPGNEKATSLTKENTEDEVSMHAATSVLWCEPHECQNCNAMTQEELHPLIHRACAYGELDTLTDLIEVKGTDPCMVDEVIT